MAKALIVGLSLTMFMLGCGEVEDPHDHACQVMDTNSEWTFVDLKLHHSDTRSCPQNVTPGDEISAGGRLEDKTASYPSTKTAEKAWLNIHNTNDGCTNLGAVVGEDEEAFYWQDFDYDNVQDWTTLLSGSYTAGTGGDVGRDCPVFIVDLSNREGHAIAKTMIDYFNEKF